MKAKIPNWMVCIAFGFAFSGTPAFSYDNSVTSILIAKAAPKKKSKKAKPKSEEAAAEPTSEEAAKDPALDASKKKKKASRKSLGVIGSAGYEDADWTEGEAKYSLGGLGFAGGANYSLHVHDKISLPVSLGLRMVSIAGENDKGTLTLSATAIFIEAGVDAWLGQSFAIGGIVGMDVFMSGSYSFEFKEGSQEKLSTKLSSYSRMAFGLGARYFVTESFKIYGDFLLTSGEFKEEPLEVASSSTTTTQTEPSATKYAGKVMRLGIGFYFL